MTPIEIALYVVIAGSGLVSFLSFILARNTPGSKTLMGVSLVIFGTSMLAGIGRYQYRLALVGVRTEGVITKITPARKSWRPLVSFPLPDGETQEFRCKHGVLRETYTVGEVVPVLYLESDPTFAVVATWTSLYQPILLGTLICSVPVGLGVFLLRRARR